MAMNDIRLLARLMKELESCPAEIRKALEIIMLSVNVSSVKELTMMMGLNEIHRKACIIKIKLLFKITESFSSQDRGVLCKQKY